MAVIRLLAQCEMAASGTCVREEDMSAPELHSLSSIVCDNALLTVLSPYNYALLLTCIYPFHAI